MNRLVLGWLRPVLEANGRSGVLFRPSADRRQLFFQFSDH
jgi:hypothetical protein